MRVLVTGSSGFVGKKLLQVLETNGIEVLAGSREPLGPSSQVLAYGDAFSDDALFHKLQGIHAIVHLAGIAHQEGVHASEFEAVNVEGTRRLCDAAKMAGVETFIFFSSIKAMGEFAPLAQPFEEAHVCKPTSPYGVSKFRAERCVEDFGFVSATIIRPVLVYGDKPKGNIEALARRIQSRRIIPVGRIPNHRSLLSLDRLAILILEVLKQKQAGFHTYIACDAKPVSTEDVARALGEGIGVNPRIIRLPSKLLYATASIIGRRSVADRIFGSLVASSRLAERAVGWIPEANTYENLRASVEQKR